MAYSFANGIPIDDMMVLAPVSPEGQVVHVEDCKKARDWMASVKGDYYGSKNGAPKHPNAVCIVISRWKDGFCYNRCKANRSLDVMTMAFGAPKHLVNGTDNTFPVALGLKKANGWIQVEQRFKEDMQELETTDEPHVFFNGVTGQMIPVFVKVLAVIADRPERATMSATISCSSNSHRRFSVSGTLYTPRVDTDAVEARLAKERNGTAVPTWSWCDPHVSSQASGGKLPSCYECRKRRILKLGAMDRSEDAESDPVNPCNKCHDWDMLGEDHDNREPLDFPQHKDCPTHCHTGSPVPAPKGRDVFQRNGRLPFKRLSFSDMTQASKFAHYQASRKEKSWNKATTLCYLTHCGVPPKLAAVIYDCADNCRKFKKQNEIDFSCPVAVKVPPPNDPENTELSVAFPPSWTDSVGMDGYIETFLHQFALGCSKSNFELVSELLKELPDRANSGLNSTALRRNVQLLLQDLKPLTLNWTNAMPFNQSEKRGCSTGGWVGEQWLSFARFSKPLFAWMAREPDKAAKHGVNDVARLVISFHAVLSRCLTHSGVDEALIAEANELIKEHLSSVRDLDLRTNHKLFKKGAATASDTSQPKTEAFWEKSNYVSLLNLPGFMRVYGPPIEWWDAGGKGEKHIQKVKPLIKRGVRGDIRKFCVGLLEKLCGVDQMTLLEKRYMSASHKRATEESPAEEPTLVAEDDDDDGDPVTSVLNDLSDLLLNDDNDNSASTRGIETNAHEDNSKRAPFSTRTVDLEEVGMTKKRSVHVYRSFELAKLAIDGRKPVAGTIEVTTDQESGKTAFEFQIVHRKPVKQCARRKVLFDDANGVNVFGVWCANILVDPNKESHQSTTSLSEVQGKAGLSAVAIPLSYVFGDQHEYAQKYYVTTNWWKERMSDGSYKLSTLDFTLYEGCSTAMEDLEDLSAMQQETTNRGQKRSSVQI